MQQTERNQPRYGQVWLVDLDPVTGSEIGGRCPGLVVSGNESNQYSATVTILPITSRPAKRRYPDEVILPEGIAGLSRQSRLKANMVRTISKMRLVRPIGTLPDDYHADVNKALKIHLNMK